MNKFNIVTDNLEFPNERDAIYISSFESKFLENCTDEYDIIDSSILFDYYDNDIDIIDNLLGVQ